MNLGMTFAIALRALRVNALRSVLTMLGIIIGVAAVITTVAIGAGAQDRVSAQIANLGTNIITVFNGSTNQGGVQQGSGTQISLSLGDAEAIRTEIASVAAVAPTVRSTVQVVAGNLNWSAPTMGTSAGFFVARSWDVADGRLFTEDEARRAGKVVVLGQTVAGNLFPDGDAVGQYVRLAQVPFEVIGILQKKGQNSFGQDQDDIAVIPIRTAKTRVSGRLSRGRPDAVQQIMIKVEDGADMKLVEADLAELLRQRHRLQPNQPDDFVIRNLSELLATREASQRILSLLLLSVAAVSLVVGGIGIMNIMLVSVTERTREIGLRMAVGARRKDILVQFLMEAVALSLIGGAIGIAIGLGASAIIAHFAGWPTLVQPDSLVLSFVFAGAVGVFFGFYPARKAARLDPIVALRYE